jgi:hypothetical protein
MATQVIFSKASPKVSAVSIVELALMLAADPVMSTT